ncbi:E3 SUMO-protein ligase ZBED1-like [Arctopsyche grandis]|uniref:E3 SUMO-protein ligase ZBED1-like n=1 Tax=Arctopsyche grandis TaxID=121162 RepID=UPI00406D71F8
MSSKRKHSPLWTHFTEDIDNKKAKCNHCSTIISIAGGSNGNLTRHMKTKHLLIPLTAERQTPILPSLNSLQSSQSTCESENIISASSNIVDSQQSMTQYIRRPPPVRKIEQIDKQLVKMVAKGHHALRIVEETEFRKLIELVSQCPGYKLPSRKTLSENLMSRIHNDVMAEAKIKVQAAPALSLSTDGWTSRNNDSYIAIVAHFINEETKLHSVLLGCINYKERHTSQNLCDFMKVVMAEWNISHKVAAIVSDNAANILSAVRLGDWRSISCFAHSLNLVVQEATKKICDVLGRVKNIVEFFNRSTQGKHKLAATQQQMNLPVLKLKQDVQTRWNSTFDMLKRIVQVKDAVIATVALLRPDLTLNEGDWEVIEEVLPLLSPFYEITVEISAEKNVTLSKIIILFDVQSLLKKGMEDRFKDIEKNMLYAECTILDPRFKTRGFKNQRACEMVVQALRNKIGQVQLVQGDTPEAVPTSSDASTSIPSNKNSCIWDEYDQEIQKITRPDNQLAAGIRELDKYLNEEYLNRKEDPLQWWHERRLIYPHVYAYVLKRFCVVATSVPCERVFSATGQVLNERRTLLSSNKVSKLIFLHTKTSERSASERTSERSRERTNERANDLPFTDSSWELAN